MRVVSGRTVNYGYDSLYRLTSETIASDPNNINGAVNYTYDSVSNRKQITSTLAPVPAGLWNYDANDRFTAGDTYDSDGNTISSGGIAVSYDFENHLVQKAGVTIVYDGDGNRVSKTVAGLTTTYLVDTLNPTGYAQVVYETFSGSSAPNRELNHIYVYGLELIGQTRNYVASSQSNTQQIYYDYDGHGSVRGLTDSNGNVTDTYDYDAFGNLIRSATTLSSPTPNNYLFAGEQFDPDLGLYYNRARYLNVSTGRFWSMDTFEGATFDPQSLHRFLYAGDDPVDSADPTGNLFVSNLVYGRIVHKKIGDDCEERVPGCVSDTSVKGILEINIPGGRLRPDLTDVFNHLVYEIKPVGSEALGAAQVSGYAVALTMLDPNHNVWVPGELYVPPEVITINGHAIAFVSPPILGVIIYEVEDLVEIVSVATVATGYQLGSVFATAALTTAYAGVP